MPSSGRRGLGIAPTAGVIAIAAAAAAPASMAAQAIDTVLVTLSEDVARVELRIPNTGDIVEALAMRFPQQTVDVTEVRREGEALLDATLAREEGALRFAVASGAPIVVRYEVTGSLDRIPLFVPGGTAELTVAGAVEESFLLRLTGAPAVLSGIDTDTSLPRFARLEDGSLEAGLTSLPSFVRLSAGGPFSFSRIADAIALALIALGMIFAVLRLRRAARGPAASE